MLDAISLAFKLRIPSLGTCDGWLTVSPIYSLRGFMSQSLYYLCMPWMALRMPSARLLG